MNNENKDVVNENIMKDRNIIKEARKYFDMFCVKTDGLAEGMCKRTFEHKTFDNGYRFEEINYGNHEITGPFLTARTEETVKEGEYKGDVKATLSMVGRLDGDKEGDYDVAYAECSALLYSPVTFPSVCVRQRSDECFIVKAGEEAREDLGNLYVKTRNAMYETEVEDITGCEEQDVSQQE